MRLNCYASTIRQSFDMVYYFIYSFRFVVEITFDSISHEYERTVDKVCRYTETQADGHQTKYKTDSRHCIRHCHQRPSLYPVELPKNLSVPSAMSSIMRLNKNDHPSPLALHQKADPELRKRRAHQYRPSSEKINGLFW